MMTVSVLRYADCLRHQTIAIQKGLQLTLYDSLQQLRQERQIRHGPVVFHMAGVESVFLSNYLTIKSAVHCQRL